MILDHLGVHHTHGKTNCLWCGNSSLSMEDTAPHIFQCFKCKASGNAFTYLRQYYVDLPAITPAQARSLCALKKGIKPLTLRDAGVRCFGERYYIPLFSANNELVSLHKYVPDTNIVYNCPKPTSFSLIGMQNFEKAKDTVYIAEGHWDYLVLLQQMPDDYNLLGCCGSYFPTNMLCHLKDKHVVMPFDNDEAGRNGINYVARHLKTTGTSVSSLSYLDWSRITLPKGEVGDKFDIRDLHNALNN